MPHKANSTCMALLSFLPFNYRYNSSLCSDTSYQKNKEQQLNKDGSKNNFYSLGLSKDFDDLAEHLELDGFEFNIGKTLFMHKGDRHDGTNKNREVKKCLHYAIRRAFKHLGKEETIKMMEKYAV